MSNATAAKFSLSRRFSNASVSPFGSVTWETRDASIKNAAGEVIFEQKGIQVPKGWSQTATNIVASKYFWGKLGTPGRESSVREMVARVVLTITESGVGQGYFETRDAEIFRDELAAILLEQRAAFNSPVFFNVGLDRYEPGSKATNYHWSLEQKKVVYQADGYKHPQCSACFIQSVEDSMEGIMELARNEAMLFKYGSGTGTNLSALRSSHETVSGGGQASGPLSFMKGFDAFAGVIKSGGKTRRAAKMVILNVDHPDIESFINCKLKEEEKAHTLIAAGYDGSGPDSEAYSSIFYQNSNNSVRVSDDFMSRANGNGCPSWDLKAVKDGKVIKISHAGELLHQIAEATWACGDPGMQFDDTINRWHTCKESGRINASNPCSEYMFLDDSACNLASINLLKYLNEDGSFDVEGFKHTVDILILAQDILVDMSGYPTEKIARNSHDFRPLGLGYANLGAVLMAKGLAYDSDEGRSFAAKVTAIMTSEAYRMSAEIAGVMPPMRAANQENARQNFGASGAGPWNEGACPGWFKNAKSFADVIASHVAAAMELDGELSAEAGACWWLAQQEGQKHGYRNSQVTVLAPTGTIGFLMDCDTTGIEPELSLIKYKKLVGGGQIKIVNETVSRALHNMGYMGPVVDAILGYIAEHNTVEGTAYFDDAGKAVFDTSFPAGKSRRSIRWQGHLEMMAAVQPFLSGAISKTVNMPEESTVEDITTAYTRAWELGLKSVAIYRDGSKKNQVLTTKKPEVVPVFTMGSEAPRTFLPKEEFFDVPAVTEDLDAPPRSKRHRLPDERPAYVHKFNIAGHEGYITTGMYKNGMPGEVFIKMAKEGSTVSGLMDTIALLLSIGLQHGMPLVTVVEKLSHTRFEPCGFTPNPDIKYAKSPVDYLARYLEGRFLKPKQQALFDAANEQGPPPLEDIDLVVVDEDKDTGDAPSCSVCGSIMVRNGSCYKCGNCGSTSGCS